MSKEICAVCGIETTAHEQFEDDSYICENCYGESLEYFKKKWCEPSATQEGSMA